MRAKRIMLPGPSGPIPALITAGDPAAARAGVVLGYGLTADMHAQWPEAKRLAAGGYAVIIPEAPHHGLRRDGYVDRMMAQPKAVARSLFLDLLEQGVVEIPVAVDHLVAAGARRIAFAGVSMSGHLALAAPSRDPRVEHVIAFMGDPAWDGRLSSPDRAAGAFAGRSLFVVTADDDEVVSPAPVRAFVRALAERSDDRAQYVEVRYAGGHMMRPEDWNDAWERAITWLNRRVASTDRVI